MDLPLSQTSSVCVESLPSCDTDYNGDIHTKFTAIYSTLLTKEDIKKEFALENYELKSVSIYEDANDIDIDKLEITMKSQTDTTLKLLFTNNNNFDIICYPYKLELAKSK